MGPEVALNVGCRHAAVWSLSGEKRTSELASEMTRLTRSRHRAGLAFELRWVPLLTRRLVVKCYPIGRGVVLSGGTCDGASSSR